MLKVKSISKPAQTIAPIIVVVENVQPHMTQMEVENFALAVAGESRGRMFGMNYLSVGRTATVTMYRD